MYTTYGFTPAATDFDWDDLTTEYLFTFNLLDDITLTQTSGEIEQYLLTIRANYRESPDGNAWTGGEINNGYSAYVNQRYHPATGDIVTAADVLDAQFTAYK